MKTYKLAMDGSGVPRYSGRELHRTPFVATGEYRAPLKGEYYLSGAIPEVYLSLADLTTNQRFNIMRPIRQD